MVSHLTRRNHKQQPVRRLPLLLGPRPEKKMVPQQVVCSGGPCPLTAVDSQMFLQVMFILESFSTLAAFELAVSSLVQQRQL